MLAGLHVKNVGLLSKHLWFILRRASVKEVSICLGQAGMYYSGGRARRRIQVSLPQSGLLLAVSSIMARVSVDITVFHGEQRFGSDDIAAWIDTF